MYGSCVSDVCSPYVGVVPVMAFRSIMRTFSAMDVFMYILRLKCRHVFVLVVAYVGMPCLGFPAY